MYSLCTEFPVNHFKIIEKSLLDFGMSVNLVIHLRMVAFLCGESVYHFFDGTFKREKVLNLKGSQAALPLGFNKIP